MPTIITDPSTAHFVKFYRGSPAAWRTLLENPSKISDDTLYFIYESVENTREGKLYLGQKLISGSSSGGGSVGDTININDLADVFIDDETLSHKQILVYNDATNKWENTSLSTIINTAVGEMVGATASTDGISGLVPVPSAGDQNKFLSGSGTWKTIDVPNVPTFDAKVFSLDNTNTVSLKDFNLAPTGSYLVKGSDNKISWTQESPSKFSMKVVTLEKLQAMVNGTDSEEPDPQAIYLIANGNDVTTANAYDEYIVINNTIEKLGQFANVDLNDYVMKTTFESAVQSINSVLYDRQNPYTGDIESLGLISRVSTMEVNYVSKVDIGDLNNLLLSPGNLTLVEEINDINERIKWQELAEE